VRLNPDRLLTFANIGAYLISLGLPAAIFLLKTPSSSLPRALIAIISGWVGMVVYITYVLNRVNIAASHAAGEHFPEARFDNNTTAAALIAGWLGPSLAVGIVAVARWTVGRMAASMTARTPNKSLERTREG
jgi:hypothetical protein